MIKTTRSISAGIYPRRRLFAKLDHLRDFPVIWISAPAGSGKTALVSSYIETKKLSCLWYQFDKRDEDIATFFHYMGLAAKKSMPRMRRPMPHLTPEYLKGIQSFARQYFALLFALLKKPCILVFDDYHELSPESLFHEMIRSAFSQIIDGISVIVISRKDPPDIFLRMKANNQMAMIRWEDIRLNEEECRAVILQRHQELEPGIIKRLHELSDGWAAGMVLLIDAVKRNKMLPESIGNYSYEEIFTYFSLEAFGSLNRQMQIFLVTTAFLYQMTIEMAEELTGNSEAETLLKSMTRNNYFITMHLDSCKAIYKYHILYRSFLLEQARHFFQPESLADVKNRAAMILEKAGDTEAAVNLLKENGNWDAITDLIHKHASEVVRQGRYLLLQEWLHCIPDEITDKNPWLLLFKGMSILPFEPSLAVSIFERSFAAFQAEENISWSLLAGAWVINAIIYEFDNFSSLEHWYCKLKDLSGKISEPSCDISGFLMIAEIMTEIIRSKDNESTERWEKRAIEIPEKPESLQLKFSVLQFLFWYTLQQRGAQKATSILTEMNRLSSRMGSPQYTILCIHFAEMMLQIDGGSYDLVLENAEKGLEISAQTGIHILDEWFHIYVFITYLDRMQYKEAQEVLKPIASLIDSWPNWCKSLYYTQLLRLKAKQGELDKAKEYGTYALELAGKVNSIICLSIAHLFLSEIFYFSGEKEVAVKHLENARALVSADSNSNITMMINLFDAQIAFDNGEKKRGLSLLRDVLGTARQRGYFMAGYDINIRILQEALEAGIEVEHVRAIIRQRRIVPEKPSVDIEDWPWTVKVFTLGTFGIIKDGSDIHGATSRKAQQKPLALLKALIALGGRNVQEDKISDILWPDSEGDMARKAFDTTLHRLRKLLGHAAAVQLRNGMVSLSDRYCWVDVWAFESLLNKADEALEKGEEDRAKRLTEKALTFYQGDFLADDVGLLWLKAFSHRVQRRFVKSALWLGEVLEKTDRWEEAALYYERILDLAQGREDVFRRLKACYDRLGSKSDAPLVFQRFQKNKFLLEVPQKKWTHN